MMKGNRQTNSKGQLKHFLSIDGLKRDLLVEILDNAESFTSLARQGRSVKKVPLLRGKTITNLFLQMY